MSSEHARDCYVSLPSTAIIVIIIDGGVTTFDLGDFFSRSRFLRLYKSIQEKERKILAFFWFLF